MQTIQSTWHQHHHCRIGYWRVEQCLCQQIKLGTNQLPTIPLQGNQHRTCPTGLWHYGELHWSCNCHPTSPRNDVKAPRTFDGATCTKVNWRRVSMKESSNKVELDWRERKVWGEMGKQGDEDFKNVGIANQVKLKAWLQNYGWFIYSWVATYPKG